MYTYGRTDLEFFLQPEEYPVNTTATNNVWNIYARAYNLLNAIHSYSAMHRTVAALIQQHYRSQTDLILDAGCGTGNFMTHLSKYNVPLLNAIGIDASPEMCAIARERHGTAGAHIKQADLNAPLPFENKTFSGIVCVNALYAVKNPVETVREFARVLRKDGALVIATPHNEANLGLILKSHAKSLKPDAYWMRFSEGGDVARTLLFEAFEKDNFDPELLEIVFSTNTALMKNSKMHFMSAAELNAVCRDAGLSVEHTERTYADQGILVYATHTHS